MTGEPCGTPAAYQRHRRRGEVPCDADSAAHAAERARNRRWRQWRHLDQARRQAIIREVIQVLADALGAWPS
jgi:acyl-CoA reductase-like NAD-dependent aldehyde dehydrogenase